MFHRLYRVDPSRSEEGSGLGLSYARAAAGDHLGDIPVEPVQGEFSEFTIELTAMSVTAMPHQRGQKPIALA